MRRSDPNNAFDPESKLEETATPPSYEAVNDRLMSTTDPDAATVRKGGSDSRLRYHHHRVVDNAQGVITAVETTPGSMAENKKLLELVDQHQANTARAVETVVADHNYGQRGGRRPTEIALTICSRP